jgi:protein gp37
MSAGTSIEWADHTFNPWSGCAKVSAGCTHCYAAALPPRMRRHALWGPDARRVPATDEYWRQPLAWDRAAAREGVRARVFCASTADVFEDRGDLDPWRIRLWELIKETRNLDWILLTKRPERMASWAAEHPWPYNAWAGTSVENQAAAAARIPHLLQVRASVRFLSCEPLLGPVDVSNWLTGIEWVIVGGESGHSARPMSPTWARSLRDQAEFARVPFFFKQWGEWAPSADAENDGKDCHLHDYGEVVWRVGKRAAGRSLDGREHLAFPRGVA